MKTRVLILVACISLAAVAAMAHGGEEHVMGTVVTLDVYPVPEAGDAWTADLRRRTDRARLVLQHADHVFSTWRRDSPVSCLRRGEITLAEVRPELAAVMNACHVARRLSGGWFDPWAMPGGFDPTGYVKGWAAQQAPGC